MITTDLIKKLRDSTGVSVMQCKSALEEAGGDLGKAVALLKKKSKDIALKKSDRTLGAGVIQAYIHSGNNVGALVELLCETDFVSKNEEFRALAYDIAMHITASNPEFIKKEDISDEVKKATRELFVKDVEGKPNTVKEKILDGKLDAYFSERVLLEQTFIKNPELKVRDLINTAVQKFGEKIEISRFTRFSI